MVRPLPFFGDDRALAAALKAGSPGAMEALYDRHAPYISRIIARIVNVNVDLTSLLHDAFIQAFTSIHTLKDNRRLKSWLTSVAVFTVRKKLRRRSYALQICYPDSDQVDRRSAPPSDPEVLAALRDVYEVLDDMPVDERIAFSLRFIEEMELKEVAVTCRVSLATIKRRLNRARSRFCLKAAHYPLLVEWMREGGEWEVT